MPPCDARWWATRLMVITIITGLVLIALGVGNADGALGPARWRIGRICVENHTGWRWSSVTDDAVRGFNNTPDLRVWYRGPGGCAGWEQVIKIRNYWGGKNGTVGYAALAWYTDAGGRRLFASPLTVNMNSSYASSMTWSVKLHAVNHELGHAVGLGHTTRRDSVMGPNPRQTYLSTFDRREIERRYPW